MSARGEGLLKRGRAAMEEWEGGSPLRPDAARPLFTLAPIWLPHWPAWMWTISLMVAAWVGLGAVTERWAPPGLDGRFAGAAPLRRERYCERGGGDNGGSHGPAAPHIDKAAAAGPALPLDGAARSPRSHWTARREAPPQSRCSHRPPLVASLCHLSVAGRRARCAPSSMIAPPTAALLLWEDRPNPSLCSALDGRTQLPMAAALGR